MKPQSTLDLAGQVTHLTSNGVAPMAIADAYEALMAMETLSADDEKLLFEISLGLSSWNYRGLGSRATATMLELVELRGVDHFRPAVPDPGEA